MGEIPNLVKLQGQLGKTWQSGTRRFFLRRSKWTATSFLKAHDLRRRHIAAPLLSMRGCSRGVSTLAKSLRLTPRTSTSSAYPGLSRSSSTFGSVRYRRAEVLRTPCLQQRQFSDAFIGKPIQQKPILPLQSLPFSCPGCGALTQWINADDAGFYSPNRKAVKAWLRRLTPRPVSASPSEIERGEDVAVAKDIEVVSGNGAVQDDSGLGTSIGTLRL